MFTEAPAVTVLGTVPQWMLLGVVILGVFKLITTLRSQTLEGKQKDIDGLRSECADLRDKLRECRESCEESDQRSRAVNRALQEEVFGLRKQHLAEQISLINIIIESVDAPELRTMLRTLESVQAQLRLQQTLAIKEPK